jgi:hypothetical protein
MMADGMNQIATSAEVRLSATTAAMVTAIQIYGIKFIKNLLVKNVLLMIFCIMLTL